MSGPGEVRNALKNPQAQDAIVNQFTNATVANQGTAITPETVEWLKRMQGNQVQPMYNKGLLNTSNMPQSYGNNVQSMFQGYKGE